MDYLHKILVHIPSATELEADAPKEVLLSAIISHAKNETEHLYKGGSGCLVEGSAGFWSDTYPQQAYIASDDLEWFINELVEVQAHQKHEIDDCLHHIREAAGTDLSVLTELLWNNICGVNALYLRRLSQYLAGEFQRDSGFYNTNDYTARLYEYDFDAIRETPSEWALVMFDYHD